MRDYLILDDIVPIDYQNLLLKTFEGKEVDWKFSKGEYKVSEEKLKVVGTSEWGGYLQLVKAIYSRDVYTNNEILNDENYMPLVSGVLSLFLMKFGLSFSFNNLTRIKVNLGFQHPLYSKDSYGIPHVDALDNKWVMIYYINDSDGDTFLFDQKLSYEKEMDEYGYEREKRIVVNNYTILKRIQPKQGRILLIRGDQYHAGSPPIKSLTRGVINYVFSINHNFLL